MTDPTDGSDNNVSKCSNNNNENYPIPKVVNDARFRAGRTLIKNGQADKALNIFSSLLEEARTQFGDDHIETCPAYYEYGNALLRHFNRKQIQSSHHENNNGQQQHSVTNSKESLLPQDQKRKAIADAAMLRAQQMKAESSSLTHNKDNNLQQEGTKMKSIYATKSNTLNTNDCDEATHINNHLDNEDIHLSLEMMETAWSIIDEWNQKKNNSLTIMYHRWIQEEIPRILTGLGDVLSSLQRYPDAVDAYTRALGHREQALEINCNDDKYKLSIAYLTHRRLIVETNILVAEALLSCPYNKDVVTTESKAVLVKHDISGGIIDYARGYYDKARDELQEVVLIMGQLAASGNVDIQKEKEDICFAATMVMGVGTSLAEIDEEQQILQSSISSKIKKQKTS
jgi:tetratricopeptide (TPR) repeat protein